MNINDKISGTYSKLFFSGTVYHIKNDRVYVALDKPYHRNLPVGKIIGMGTDEEICILCSFKTTDKNIALDVLP